MKISGWSPHKRPLRNNWNQPMWEVYATKEGARLVKPKGKLYRVTLSYVSSGSQSAQSSQRSSP